MQFSKSTNKTVSEGSDNNRQLYKVLIIGFLVAIILRLFFISAVAVPSHSMSNTLLVGDNILVNKSAYGLHLPLSFPLFNIDLSTINKPMWGTPKLGDVVVFDGLMPSFLKFKETGFSFVKRVIGTPGDTIEIVSGAVKINGVLIDEPYAIHSELLRKRKNSITDGIFPPEIYWNEDFYGPVIVPTKNKIVVLDSINSKVYYDIISFENKPMDVTLNNDHIYIAGTLVSKYQFKKDYYFLLGDNRDYSRDSRFYGFIPYEHIIGKGMCIFFSKQIRSESFWSGIRFNRIFSLIK